MRIASSSVQMDSSHLNLQKYERKETLRAWVGDQRPNFEERTRAHPTLQPIPSVTISDTGKATQSSEAAAIQESIEAAENDPMLSLIRAMIAMLTGKDVTIFDASTLDPDQPHPEAPTQTQPPAQQVAGFGVEYDRHESYTEIEQTSFEASGVVRTSDGKEISFTFSLAMTRSYHEESNTSLRLGDARQKQDPLVLNFDGAATQLTSQRFKFDLDSDGQAENINFVTGGSGFLALDRNGDGKVNNGSELFGTASGDGFAELSSLDMDHNGWIDENDTVYEQLRIWSRNAKGEDQLTTLKQANVGAIGLASISTPFDLKDGQNELLGQIRASGLFLREDGPVGSIQQVDLTI